MQRLSDFLEFDFERFIDGKNVVVKDVRPWYEYVNGEITERQLGLRVDLLIIHDATEYHSEEFENANFGETFTVKVKDKFELPISFQDEVLIIGAEARVYGRYQNNLSVVATNVVKKQRND